MMKHYQTGATMWTTLSVTLMLGFVGYFGVIVGGMYWDNYLIRNSMKEIVNQANFKTMGKREVLSSIGKRLTVDGIRDLDRKKAFMVKKDKSGEKYIHVQYENQSSLFANLFITAKFDQEIKPGQE